MADIEQPRTRATVGDKKTGDSTALNSLPMAFKLWARKIGLDTENCIPAIVSRYDENDRMMHQAIVQPLVSRETRKGERVDRAQIRVTVLRQQSGGFLVDMPMFVGDTGWVIGADRSTRFAKANNSSIQEENDGYGKSKKNKGIQSVESGNLGTHRYTDGFFIPDSWGKIALPKGSEGALVIEQISGDGKSNGRILLGKDGSVTYESDHSETKVVERLDDIPKGSTAKFREQKRVIGFKNATLKTVKSSVLATQDIPDRDIHIPAYEPDEVSVNLTPKDPVTGEQRLQLRDIQKSPTDGVLLDLMKGTKEGEHQLVTRKKVNGKWRVEYLAAGHGLDVGAVSLDDHSIDYSANGSVEMADFQGASREHNEQDADGTIEKDIVNAAKESADVGWWAPIRERVGNVYRLFYKRLGLLVSAITHVDGDGGVNRYQGDVEIAASPDTDNCLTITDDKQNNRIVFKASKGGGSSTPAPFDIDTIAVQGGSTGGVASNQLKKVFKNCTFYWDGRQRVVGQNGQVDAAPCIDAGIAWLVCACHDTNQQTETWEFSIQPSVPQEQTGQRVIGYKLYDFVNGEVSVDYRHTFLEINSPRPRAVLTVETPNNASTRAITLDATVPADAQGFGGDVSIRTQDIPVKDGQAQTMSVREVTIAGGETDPKKVYVLATEDFTVGTSAGSSLGPNQWTVGGKTINVNADEGASIPITYLQEGDGIRLTKAGDTITIEAIGGGGGVTDGYTGSVDELYDTDYFVSGTKHVLRKRFITKNYNLGLLTSFTIGGWQEYHTAVPETV